MAQDKKTPFDTRGLTTMAFIAVALAACALGYHLYRPCLPRFASTYYLTPASHILAAVGAFLFSRRWIGSQIASFFAAMLYAFGPFALSLDAWHPAIPALFAVIPWCFCPAAFWQRWFEASAKLPRSMRLIITMILSLLPLVPIAIVFEILPHFHIFPMPVRAGLTWQDLVTIVEPAQMSGVHFSVGFYHVALPALVLGLAIFIRLRRVLPGLMLLAAIIGAFLPPAFEISPIIWLVIAVLGLSVIAGLGLEGMTLIGRSDWKWLAAAIAAAVTAFIAAAALEAMRQPREFFSTRLFCLALLPPVLIAVMVWRDMRVRQLRWLFLAVAMALDIVVSSRHLLDSMF